MDQGDRDNNSSENELPIWEREPYKEWAELSYEKSDIKRVRCTLCKGKEMQAIRATLDGHAGTEQHKQRKKLREKEQQQSATSSQIAEISQTPSLKSRKRSRLLTQEATTAQPDGSDMPKFRLLKFFELKLLLCNVIHSSTLHGDHHTEILSGLSDASSHLSSFVGAHGKKCIEIMKIVAKDIRQKLHFDIGKQPYSIFINEYQWSYEPNEQQYFCLCIRYFSEKRQSIATNFLGFIEVSRTINHHELGELVIKHLRNFALDLQNLIGLGAEAANLKLTAEFNSLYGSLRRRKSSLQLIPFLSHSLDTCFSEAVKNSRFRRDLRYIWISIHNLLAQDPTLSFQYTKIFPNVKKNLKNKFSISEESWLLGINVIHGIVNSWSCLKKIFQRCREKSTDIFLEKNLQ